MQLNGCGYNAKKDIAESFVQEILRAFLNKEKMFGIRVHGMEKGGGKAMQNKAELLAMIGQEKKMLDELVLQNELEQDKVYEQSKRVDALLEQYYREM